MALILQMKMEKNAREPVVKFSEINRMQLLMIPDFEKSGMIRHAFTTRQNGLGGRKNGIKSPSDWHEVAEAFDIAPDRVVTVNQVHGDYIVKVDGGNYRNMRSIQADAMLTDVPGIAIGVETADCVPILLLDPIARAAAAVHAGWRSTVKKIAQKAVIRMREEYGSDPARMIAAIGPAIGPECYEVDEPVMGPVRGAFPFWQDIAMPLGNDRWGLDLVKANRMELREAGLDDKNILSLGLCTSCRRDLFYSYRAEGRTGRMLSVIMIKP